MTGIASQTVWYMLNQFKQTTLTPAAGGGKEELICIVVSPLVLVMNKILQPTACLIWRGGGWDTLAFPMTLV
ncbi:hypothetical protein E2C01_041360 [Portunus trituberculatus]|uniref:Uncharacterized protein n=1 Tax=Portunus trituberculatus TaxID=210409 RepID=A0A5B7FRP6_PORTR|nr:hypothetical protein [Portunus trituberculatus]